jgi:hypothetical protein
MNRAKTINVRASFGEHLLSSEEGERLRSLIRDDIANGLDVILDFCDVRIVASSFLNAAIGRLYSDVPEPLIREHLKAPNLSDDGKFTLEGVVKNSQRYYADERFRAAVDASEAGYMEA